MFDCLAELPPLLRYAAEIALGVFAIGGLLALATFGLLVEFLRKLMRSLARMELRCVDARDDRVQRAAERIGSTHAWAAHHGFDFLGYFEGVSRSITVAWQQREAPRYLTLYLVMGTNEQPTDLVSAFADDDTALTTGTTRDAGFLPEPPASYLQSFPEATLDELWQRHLEGERAVASALCTRLAPQPEPFTQRFTRRVQGQAQYVMGHRLWPVRMLVWYFTRRGKLKNVPIAQQLQVSVAQ